VHRLGADEPSLFVSDQGKFRVSVLDSEGSTLLSIRVPGRPNDVLRDGSGRILVSLDGAPPAFGPVRVYDRNGQFLRRIGVEAEPGAPAAQVAVRADTILISYPFAYAVDLHDTTGERVRSIRRSISWFPALAVRELLRRENARSVRPVALIRDIEVANDLLWLLLDRPRQGRASRSDTQSVPSLAGVSTRLTSVIEVYSLTHNRFLASQSFPGLVLRELLPAGRVLELRSDSSGRTVARIWRARLSMN
jgi:hypothetical protein